MYFENSTGISFIFVNPSCDLLIPLTVVDVADPKFELLVVLIFFTSLSFDEKLNRLLAKPLSVFVSLGLLVYNLFISSSISPTSPK